MSGERSGGHARPLTHRQQKRAKKRQTQRERPSMSTQASAAPLAETRAHEAVKTPPAMVEKRGDTIVTAVATKDTHDGDGALKEPEKPEIAAQALAETETAVAMEARLESDEIVTTAAQATRRRKPRPIVTETSMMPEGAPGSDSESEIVAADMTEGSVQTLSTTSRKYPTLARMVAIAARNDQVAEGEEGATATEDTPENSGSTAEDDAEMAAQAAQAEAVPVSVSGLPSILVEAVPIAEAEPPADISAPQEQPATSPTPPASPALADAAATPAPGMPAAPRQPVTTKQLSAIQISRALAVLSSEERALASDSLLRAYTPSRPRPLPEVNLIMPVAGVHATLAAVAALCGAVLLIQGQTMALWGLLLAAIAGIGGWGAYAFSQRERRQSAAGALLLFSELGMLIWAIALIGPEAALLALASAVVLLGLRMTERAAVIASVVLILIVYIAALGLGLQGVFHSMLTAGALTLLNAALTAVGLGLLLILAMNLQMGRSRAESASRARQLELRHVRMRAGRFRQEVEDDVDQLERRLTEALHGRGVEPLEVDGVLGPLAEDVSAVAERLATLQSDREDRVRLEGAVRSVTRAFERAWLGLPWTWPEPSGTVLDDLVAFLRAPRPQDMPASWSEDTPALVPIPSATPPHMPCVPPTSIPLPQMRMNGTTAGTVTPQPRLHPKLRVVPPPNGEPSTPHAGESAGVPTPKPLPWDEWIEWSTWDDDE